MADRPAADEVLADFVETSLILIALMTRTRPPSFSRASCIARALITVASIPM
jgi:hypothetical protein